jgi:hypothetical protein
MTSAYRLHQLDKPTTIRCPAVQAQFGAGFKELRHFRTTFLKALEAALAAYPDAKVTLDEAGVLLHWSALNPHLTGNAPATTSAFQSSGPFLFMDGPSLTACRDPGIVSQTRYSVSRVHSVSWF